VTDKKCKHCGKTIFGESKGSLSCPHCGKLKPLGIVLRITLILVAIMILTGIILSIALSTKSTENPFVIKPTKPKVQEETSIFYKTWNFIYKNNLVIVLGILLGGIFSKNIAENVEKKSNRKKCLVFGVIYIVLGIVIFLLWLEYFFSIIEKYLGNININMIFVFLIFGQIVTSCCLISLIIGLRIIMRQFYYVKCPFCSNKIKANAKVCNFCYREFK
jgi:ribosomal protein S27E